MDLHDKNILVTGGSQGLGLAMCRDFAVAGAKVFLSCAHNAERGRRLADEFGATAVIFDVADPIAVTSAFAEIADKSGGLDILINNARVDPYARSADSTDAEWFDKVIGVNLKGPYLCSLAALEQMKMRGAGRIVNISSVWAYRSADQRMLEYAMSKAALHSLTRSFAGIAAPFNVTVNTVAPGLILSTEMRERLTTEELTKMVSSIPVKRGATAEEIIASVRFVIATPYMTGEIVNINGGTYMP